jgi:hypothetical protein
MFKEKPGDDTGMQTRVWGPAGWLFLHSIAQNYPWKPTDEQKKNYLSFFKSVGNVLPCRYCRDSYQKFITGVDNWKPTSMELENSDPLTYEDNGLILDMSKLKSRETLVKWLYELHNRINKKLGVDCVPTLKEVWNKYESFRSKCTKSKKPSKPKNGCLDPMKGARKKCTIEIINVDADGNAFGKSPRNQIKLISIKKSKRSDKKLMATFKINEKNRVIQFGAAGASDFTKHKDKVRRNRYIFRHKKDLKTNQPFRAGYLSMFVLWNKPSLTASINDYKRRLSVYNRTGKFPTKIT